jgi:hypothetical protein
MGDSRKEKGVAAKRGAHPTSDAFSDAGVPSAVPQSVS